MPRLVSRGQAIAGLPAYQPPACAPTEEARRALDALSHGRAAVYEAQLKESLRQLGLGVGDLHERLRAQLDRLDALRARRAGAGDKTAEERRLELHLAGGAGFEAVADERTREAERAVRRAIDHRAELEDEAAILADLCTEAAAAGDRPARDDDDDDEGGDDDEGARERKPNAAALPSTLDALRARRAAKRAEYADQLTPHERYGRNNDYAGFKKLWHDAAAGEGGPPLPDAARWFRPDGEPVMDRPGAPDRRRSAAAADDDDDEIAVAREVRSLNCPLTLRPMAEPYSNVKCKHAFDRAAILDYLPAHGEVQCPQTGCSQTFSRANFAHDFYLDQAILRRAQRAKQSERHGELDADDDDDDEDDGVGDRSVVIRGEGRVGAKALKTEPAGTSST